MLIDCHCHLADPSFDEDLDDVLERAKDADVKACICVTEFRHQFEKTLELGKRFPGFVFPCLGIHPVQEDVDSGLMRSSLLKDLSDETLDYIRSHKDKLLAIGEIGLDFTPRYHENLSHVNSHNEQRAVFTKQIQLAKELDLPVNCHSRSAGRPTIELLKECGMSRVVLHAFDGNFKSAGVGVQMGYYFSVPPCVARSEQKQKLVRNLPLKNILLETDSPALGAEKMQRNEVQYIKISVDWIAKLKNMSCEDVVQITTENALRLFPTLNKL